ncbi:MAG TPA: pyridoxal kinase PdxY [Pseudolabrys sp.]|nr:pyridoxal kinase PdxY [Pseudolabrys sp.]
MNLISIQSHVAYGHVGNSAAVFPLQRMGVEVWPIHTVQFSNHTGYDSYEGEVFGPQLIRDIIKGIDARNVLGECDGVLSGYIGSPEIGAAILDAVATVKCANPSARYCCDPVIGDASKGVFVKKGIVEFFKDKALPVADIITPNHFELDYLSGTQSKTLNDALVAVESLRKLGPRTVLVTSLRTDETPQDAIDMLACDDDAQYLLRTPRLELVANGAGDAVAALFTAHYLRLGKIGEALAAAGSAIFGVLAKTAEAGSAEIQIVAAQDEILTPSQVFEAKRIGA